MVAPTCVLIFLLHRHGMRHPFMHFGGIGEDLIPEQLGLLTVRGERQMVALGEYLRQKHIESSKDGGSAIVPLGEVKLESFSSSVLRCVESSKIVLKSFMKRDVDVSTLKTDYSELYHEMIAKNIDLMMSSEFKSDQGDRVLDYITYLNEQANSTKTTLQEKYQIVESLLTAKHNGHGLPPYADEETLKKCLNLLNRQLMKGFHQILYTEILKDMATRLSDLPNVSSNFVEYSVSDIHIVAVLEQLGIPIQHWPDYGSAFEIRINSDGSVILDELLNSPNGEISERTAIRTSSVEEIHRRAQAL